ncbi:hypothetical protein GQ42DRAFT_144537 [Ramicandelaber brevisporus]|nr:hypothetical protein GQ42DRAFT_144537 [Ramicandelaber brevisporus]
MPLSGTPELSSLANRSNVHQHIDAAAVFRVCNEMKALSIQPDRETFNILQKVFVQEGMFDDMLQAILDMKSRGMGLRVGDFDSLLQICEAKGDAYRAMLAMEYLQSTSVAKKIKPTATTMDFLLRASNRMMFAQGSQFAWKRLLHGHHVNFTEGDCLETLHVAARFGIPDMAGEALRHVSQTLGIQCQVHHMMPLVEAFARVRAWDKLHRTLVLLRQMGIVVPAKDMEYVATILAKSANVNAGDAPLTVQERLHEATSTPDVTFLNAMVLARTTLNDNEGAMQLVLDMYPVYGVKPSTRTYNILMKAAGRDVDKMRRVLDEMISKSSAQSDSVVFPCAPDTSTFEMIISESIRAPVYETAFEYLEMMKELQLIPSVSIYTFIIRRCLLAGDERWKAALDEMNMYGHPVPPALQRLIDNRLNGAAPRQQNNRRRKF